MIWRWIAFFYFLFFIFCKLVSINLIIVACCMEVSMGYVHRVPYR